MFLFLSLFALVLAASVSIPSVSLLLFMAGISALLVDIFIV